MTKPTIKTTKLFSAMSEKAHYGIKRDTSFVPTRIHIHSTMIELKYICIIFLWLNVFSDMSIYTCTYVQKLL